MRERAVELEDDLSAEHEETTKPGVLERSVLHLEMNLIIASNILKGIL